MQQDQRFGERYCKEKSFDPFHKNDNICLNKFFLTFAADDNLEQETNLKNRTVIIKSFSEKKTP